MDVSVMSTGPFGRPLFGAPAVAPIGSNANSSEDSVPDDKTTTQTTSTPARKFNVKPSALSSMADNIWKKSQSDFNTDQKLMPTIQLEKKTLNDVLGKMTAEAKERNEDKDVPKFIFGSQIKDKVLGEIPVEKHQENKDESSSSSAPKSSLLGEVTAESTSKFREESTHVAEALKKEQEKQLAGTSIVEVTTGEEDDKNILQATCKLHVFDKEKKTWSERGLCQVRINMRREAESIHYRIVARSVGNQRVIINSKIFADMFLERVDAKRLKLSAMCPETNAPQIFLLTISFSKTDLTMDALYASLTDCLKKERNDEKRKRKATDTENLEEHGNENSASATKKEKVSESIEVSQENKDSDFAATSKEGAKGAADEKVPDHTSDETNELQEGSTQDTEESRC